MFTKPNRVLLLYVAVAALLLFLYGLGLLPNPQTPVPQDVLVAASIVTAGFLSLALGAELPAVIVVGTLGSFISLTLFQSDPIRFMSLAALLFSIGFYGLVASRNAVRVLMSIELMLNAANINLVTMARYVDPGEIRGQVFAIFILTVAAAEAAVGLAIVLAIYRNTATVDMEKFNLLKW
jgi:NAD(P)H-quinone oxidoreductase subunit 4L